MTAKIQLATPDSMKIMTPSGSTVVTQENHSTPIVSFCVYFPGGVIYEDPSNQGITYLMQRLLIKGTRKRTAEEIAGEIEYLGATLHPFTGKEAFGASMQAVSRHFSHALELFAECLMDPRFPEEELEKEKINLILEIENKKDDILSHCMDLCEERLFDNSPYGFDIIGKPGSIKHITRRDVVQWHRRFYAPGRMVFTLVGDVKTRDAIKKIADAFKGFRTYHGSLEKPRIMPPERVMKHVSEERDKRQVALCLGFPAPSLLSHDYFPFKVLDYLLSGMGSRLFITLRDIEGLAYLVSSTYTARRHFGCFKAYMLTSLEKKDRALAGLLRELKALTEEAPSPEEVERVKHYMIGLHEISLQRKSSQASLRAFYELAGLGHDFVERYPRRVRRVKGEQIRQVAQKFLDTERFTCSMIAPKG
ncbi:MAG: pitrilysin family protein [Candidatus Eremiobacteraeota bacterium]|nr:pitrilysin family protein [Candidatus Eremiobacteraeota bacterium]